MKMFRFTFEDKRDGYLFCHRIEASTKSKALKKARNEYPSRLFKKIEAKDVTNPLDDK